MLAFLLSAAVVITPPAPDVQYRQPQLAARGKTAAVVFGSGNAIYTAVSGDNGRTFGKPVRVAEPGVMSLGRHRGPRIGLTETAMLVTAIAGEKGRGADGDVLAFRSIDNGVTWSAPVRVNDVAGSAREGLHTMAAQGDTVFAAWLDLRTKGTRVYGSVSRDGGATWSPNILVYESPGGSVCECCHPSAAIGANGHIYVMFRNSLAGARDMYVARSTDGGKSFASASKVGSGTWRLNACPMDGGGIAPSRQGGPVTVWRRNKEIFTASDGASEQMLGTGKDPALAVTPKGVYAAWTGDAGTLLRSPKQEQPAVLDPHGAYVHLTPAGDGKVLAAWERTGAIVVQVIE